MRYQIEEAPQPDSRVLSISATMQNGPSQSPQSGWQVIRGPDDRGRGRSRNISSNTPPSLSNEINAENEEALAREGTIRKWYVRWDLRWTNFEGPRRSKLSRSTLKITKRSEYLSWLQIARNGANKNQWLRTRFLCCLQPNSADKWQI